jgi:hypothetical protein
MTPAAVLRTAVRQVRSSFRRISDTPGTVVGMARPSMRSFCTRNRLREQPSKKEHAPINSPFELKPPRKGKEKHFPRATISQKR